MATRREVVELLIRAGLDDAVADVRRFANELNELGGEAGDVGREAQELASDLERIGRQGAAVQGFRDLKEESQQVDQALNAARVRATELGRAISQIENPTRQQTREFEKARREVRQLTQRQNEYRQQLQQSRQTLREAGVDTRNLARTQVELRRQYAQTQTAARALQTRLEEVRRQSREQLNDPTESARRGTQSLVGSLGSLNGLLASLSVATAAAGLIALGKASLQAAAELERLRLTMSSIADGDAARAASQLELLREQADRLGIAIQDIGRPFVEFQAGLKDLNIEQAESARLFGLFSESLLKAGGTAVELQDTQLGLIQSIRQGNVQWDEFRQIASRLPGAFDAASKAFGVAKDELKDFISTGQATFDQRSLTIFIEELAASVGAVGERIETISASEARASESLQRLGAAFAEASGLADAYKFVLEGVSGIASDLADQMEGTGITGAEAAAILSADFEDASEALKKARGEAEGLGDALEKTAEQIRTEKIKALKEEIERVEEEYKRLRETALSSDAALSGVDDAFKARAVEKLDLLEKLRSKLEQLSAVDVTENLFNSEGADRFTEKTFEVISALQSFEGTTDDTDKLLARFGGGLASLSDGQLQQFKGALQASLSEAGVSGEKIGVLAKALEKLETESARRANDAAKKIRADFEDIGEGVDIAFERVQGFLDLQEAQAQGAVNLAEADLKLAQATAEEAQRRAELSSTYADQLTAKEALKKVTETEIRLGEAQAVQAKEQARIEAVRKVNIDNQIRVEENLLKTLNEKLRAQGPLKDSDRELIRAQVLKIEGLKKEAVQQAQTAEEATRAVTAAQQNIDNLKRQAKDMATTYDGSLQSIRKVTASMQATREAFEKANASNANGAKTSQAAAAATKDQAAAQGELSAAVGKTNQGLSASAQLVKQVIDNTYALSIAAGDALVNKKEQVGLYQDENAEVEKLQRNLNKLLDLQRDNATRTINMTDGLNRFLQKANDIRQRFYESSLQVERLEQSVRDMRESGEIDLGRLEQAANRARTGFDYMDSAQLDGLRSEIDQTFQILDQRVESARSSFESLQLQLARLRGEDVLAVDLQGQKDIAELQERLTTASGEEAELLRQAISARREILEIERQQAAEREAENKRRRQEEKERARQNDEPVSYDPTDDRDASGGSGRRSGAINTQIQELQQVDQEREQQHQRELERIDETKRARKSAADDEIQNIDRVERAAAEANERLSNKITATNRVGGSVRGRFAQVNEETARQLEPLLNGIRSRRRSRVD